MRMTSQAGHVSSGMGIAPNVSIRLNSEVYQQARIAAVTDRKTLGQWLVLAISTSGTD